MSPHPLLPRSSSDSTYRQRLSSPRSSISFSTRSSLDDASRPLVLDTTATTEVSEKRRRSENEASRNGRKLTAPWLFRRKHRKGVIWAVGVALFVGAVSLYAVPF